jgi:hypothetical protein
MVKAAVELSQVPMTRETIQNTKRKIRMKRSLLLVAVDLVLMALP